MWLPVTAAAGVLLLLLWYALSQEPSEENVGNAGPAASALAGPGGDPAAPGAAASPTAPPPPTSGCETGATLPAGVTTEAVTVDGVERRFLLAVPQGGDTAGALPLVVNLHGFGQPAEELEQYTLMADEGTRVGFAVATPVGDQNRWNFVRSPDIGPDDVLFVGALLNDLTGRMCLDQQRIFASGFSDGADMALTLACDLPSRFAAVATVGSSRLPDSCGAPTASLLEIHGTDDPIAPFDGGGPPRTDPFEGLVAQPVRERVARYASALGCGADPATTEDTSYLHRTVWSGCPDGKDVGILAMQGGGHSWPGAAERPELGHTVTQMSATVVALAFFRGHAAVGRVSAAGSSDGPATGGGIQSEAGTADGADGADGAASGAGGSPPIPETAGTLSPDE